MNFKLLAILSSMMKSLLVLLCPTWDASHPFVQRAHGVHATGLLSQ